jgi:hypothetical protein
VKVEVTKIGDDDHDNERQKFSHPETTHTWPGQLQRGTMHHSLSILEVLSIVFSFCDRPTLNAVARTCKLFHNPALDLLWCHPVSFVTLLETMPADLWEIRGEFPIRVLVRETTLKSVFVSLIFDSSIFEDLSFPPTLTHFTNMRGESSLFHIKSRISVWVQQRPYASTSYRCQCCQIFVNLWSKMSQDVRSV